VGTNISAQARSRPRFGRCAARSRHLPNPPGSPWWPRGTSWADQS